VLQPADRAGVTTVLCDADGNLFDSEVPAFEASVVVVNQLLAALGSPARHEAEELRRTAAGRNFRSLAVDLAAELGRTLSEDELGRWVEVEKAAVTRHLTATLQPDPVVAGSLEHLADRYRLGLVTSSALSRVGSCLAVTELAPLFADADRFSAYDSLPTPTSKPDPAVYRLALRELGLAPDQAVAIEDAAAGVLSATAAGIPTIGNLAFVPAPEQDAQRRVLLESGASMVVEDWPELVDVLTSRDER
jgi:beta-phosphoglucomutase-like phosphatase (HAD superfamily)